MGRGKLELEVRSWNKQIKSHILPLNLASQFSPLTSQKGVALIKLLIVIAIISVVLGFTLKYVYRYGQPSKTKDLQRKTDLLKIKVHLKEYYSDQGRYPSVSSETDYRIKGLSGDPVEWGFPWQPYIDKLPKDPSISRKYVYYATSDRQAYYLYASLEKEDNSFVWTNKYVPQGACSANGDHLNKCNFGISSPNVNP